MEEYEVLQPKTWDEIESFDDCIQPATIEIIEDTQKELGLGKRVMCPHIKLNGKYFYYCGKDMTAEDIKRKEAFGLDSRNPIYKRVINIIELQMFCLGKCMEEVESCSIYAGTQSSV